MKRKSRIKPKTKTTSPKKEVILTKEKFFKILDRVIQPVKAKPPKKEKKGTLE